jgi:hypothetical protein
MKKSLFICCLAAIFALPAAAFAASHEHGMAGMDHGSMSKKGDIHKGMLTVGEQTVDGVKAIVYLNDVKATMAKMGMKETHHLMIHFYNAKDGKTIETGTAAVKIKGPDSKEGAAIKLIGMDKHFGADVILEQKGAYVFTVGTQLADGVKRQYELKYELK